MSIDTREETIYQGIEYVIRQSDKKRNDVLRAFTVGDLTPETIKSIGERMDRIQFESRHNYRLFESL